MSEAGEPGRGGEAAGRRWAERVAVALGFLTVLPGPSPAEGGLVASLPAFPLAGVVAGLLAGGLGWAGSLAWGAWAGAVLAVAGEAALTRGLHWDGLMDTADALAVRGVAGRERALEVMRDPRTGALGALAGTLALLLESAFLERLYRAAGALGLAALALSAATGRWALVRAVTGFAYARPEGLGRAFRGAGRREMAQASALLAALGLGLAAAVALGAAVRSLAGGGPAEAVWPAVLAALGRFLGGWAAGAAVAEGVARRLARAFGGLTGDVYGAVAVLSEIGALAAWALGL
ncbi:MAG: adenosylcobinamide-GDP ribazoletransferase [Firmicutes bacterium]|nr:adenosylcobinamide-GDP ribazoletransferase [Bacillota bacterium]